jgi:hypothetical protein
MDAADKMRIPAKAAAAHFASVFVPRLSLVPKLSFIPKLGAPKT